MENRLNVRICYPLVVNNNKYSSHVVGSIIFGISVPITQVEPLKATLYNHFGISVNIVYFIFI